MRESNGNLTKKGDAMSEFLNVGALFSHSWTSDEREHTAYLLAVEESGVRKFEVAAYDKKEWLCHFEQKFEYDEFKSACQLYELIIKTSKL